MVMYKDHTGMHGQQNIKGLFARIPLRNPAGTYLLPVRTKHELYTQGPRLCYRHALSNHLSGTDNN